MANAESKEARIIKKIRRNWKKIISILLVPIILGGITAFIGNIIGLQYETLLFPKEPKLKITAIKYEQEPAFDLNNLPSLEIVKDNETLVEYYAASMPYVYVELSNLGERVAIVDRVTVKVLRVIFYSPAILPTWNYTLVLNMKEIFCTLNLSNWEGEKNPVYPPPPEPILDIDISRSGTLEPPYSSDFEIWPHFKIDSNDVILLDF